MVVLNLLVNYFMLVKMATTRILEKKFIADSDNSDSNGRRESMDIIGISDSSDSSIQFISYKTQEFMSVRVYTVHPGQRLISFNMWPFFVEKLADF